MAPSYPVALGRKIAEARHRRGLSQAQLAGMIDRSVAWISQVERGARKVDRMSVLEMLADALQLPLSELAAEAPIVAAVHHEPPGVAELRLVLSGAWTLRAMLSHDDAHVPKGLRERATRAWSLSLESRYAELADELRDLIPDLETSVRTVPSGQRGEMFELLATSYQACAAALSKLGETDAAWIAADRSMVAAERAGNPLLVAAGAFRLGIVFIGARQYAQAAEISGTAADALWRVAESGTMEAMSIWGAITLQRATVAARLGEATAAYGFIDWARLAAKRVGPGRNDFNTEFGMANVDLYEVDIAVELGDAGRALRVATAIDVASLSAERQTQLLIDVARAHTQRRQPAQALTALLEAEGLAPEQIRSHARVRQVLADLRTMQPPPAALAALTTRLTTP